MPDPLSELIGLVGWLLYHGWAGAGLALAGIVIAAVALRRRCLWVYVVGVVIAWGGGALVFLGPHLGLTWVIFWESI